MELKEILEADINKIERLADVFISNQQVSYSIGKEISIEKKEIYNDIFGNLKFSINLPEVNCLTPYGNTYVMSVKYNLKGINLGFWTCFEKNDNLYKDVKPKFVEMFQELQNLLRVFDNHLSEITVFDIIKNKSEERLITLNDYQKSVDIILPSNNEINSISDRFTSAKLIEIKTHYDFPNENNLHNLQQYIMYSDIPNFKRKENYNYSIFDCFDDIINDKYKKNLKIKSVLEILIKDNKEDNKFEYNISHYIKEIK